VHIRCIAKCAATSGVVDVKDRGDKMDANRFHGFAVFSD